jgi:hypothetical protein
MTGDNMEIDFLNASDMIGGYKWAQADYELTMNLEQLQDNVHYRTFNAGEFAASDPLNLAENVQAFLRIPVSHVWDLWPQGTGGTLYKWDLGEYNGRFGNVWRAAVTLGHVDLDYERFVPFKNTTIRRGQVCVMNPCLRQYAIRVEAGRIETSILDTKFGVFASHIPGFNDSRSRISETSMCWVGSYRNRSSALADPFDESLLPPGASFCDTGYGTVTICDVDPKFVICDVDALRQAQMVTEALVGNKTDVSCLRGSGSAFTSMNKTHDPVHVQNTTLSSWPEKLSYVVPWDFRNYDQETYFSSAYSHALFGTDGSSLESTLENIAASLTVALQTAAGIDSIGARVLGQTTIFEAYVHVRWIWLLYPVTILTAGISFIAWTIIAGFLSEITATGSHGRQGKNLWKSNSLALIYHGPVNMTQESRDEATSISIMEEMAKDTTISMENGQMLVVEQHSRRGAVPAA